MANFFNYPQVLMSAYNSPPTVSSGAMSLGTTAGTNRSISAEWGGSQPHKISEYQGSANMEVKTRYKVHPYGSWSYWTIATDLGSWATNSDEHTTTFSVLPNDTLHLEYLVSSCSTNSLYPRDYGDPTKFSDYYGQSYCCYINTVILVSSIDNMGYVYDKNWNSITSSGWSVGQNLHNTNSLSYCFFVNKGNNSNACFITWVKWRIGYWPNVTCKCSIIDWRST